MNKDRQIRVTEMVWNFNDPNTPHQLQARLFQTTDAPWLDKVTATINNEGDSHIRFVVELYNRNGITSAAHNAVQETMEHSLQPNPDVTGIEESERFPAKHVAVIHFRKQAGVPHTFRAFDGFVEIMRSLTMGNIEVMKKNGRPEPEVTQRTIIDDGVTRMSYGAWADRQYFGTPGQKLLERLYGAIGKQVRLRVMATNGGTEVQIGVLGVNKGKGWIIEPNADKYWPLVCVEWVDVLSE